MKFKSILTGLLAGATLAASGMAFAKEDKTGILVGVDARDQSWYGYLGVTQHFGDNAYGDGLIGRLLVYSGQYEYSSEAVSGGSVNADFSAMEALLGYQKVFTAATLRTYAGLEYEGHRLSPDNPFDDNRGDHFGAKVRVDLESDFAAPDYFNLIGTYGTARERYWVRARGGRDFSGYVVGPELIATGDRLAHEERLGVFVNFRTMLPALLSISAGQAKTVDSSAGYTPYLTVEYSRAF